MTRSIGWTRGGWRIRCTILEVKGAPHLTARSMEIFAARIGPVGGILFSMKESRGHSPPWTALTRNAASTTSVTVIASARKPRTLAKKGAARRWYETLNLCPRTHLSGSGSRLQARKSRQRPCGTVQYGGSSSRCRRKPSEYGSPDSGRGCVFGCSHPNAHALPSVWPGHDRHGRRDCSEDTLGSVRARFAVHAERRGGETLMGYTFCAPCFSESPRAGERVYRLDHRRLCLAYSIAKLWRRSCPSASLSCRRKNRRAAEVGESAK